uniref:RNA-directed DNA polymerase, eukaryota, reverse transcriptase zinc-binding domain protein n=1 Tax=Tanacetum cinerariifolium TaxID=118510 RepID=A0A6L2K0B5_TANCI|nr:RNA-directed DNA polymerase, eukaryota, reverse transcriptase zinc-binding domain protein [Tanacetum cinerariifolium]
MVFERGVLNIDGDSVLLGCVKEFQSLSNIHIACFNEDRVVWIDIEGIPLRAWSQSNFERTARKWEGKIATVRAKEVIVWIHDFDFGDGNSSTSDDASEKSSDVNLNWVDEKDAKVVQDSYQRHENDNACDGNRNATPSKEPSIVLPEKILTDPVFLPGFTPLNSVNETTSMEHTANYSSPIQSHKEASNIVLDEGSKASKSCHNSLNGSYHDHADSRVRSSNPSNGFSILERFQEFINIGQAMGYDMKGSEKDFSKIISSIGENNGVK